jgi:hypothetical protein
MLRPQYNATVSNLQWAISSQNNGLILYGAHGIKRMSPQARTQSENPVFLLQNVLSRSTMMVVCSDFTSSHSEE